MNETNAAVLTEDPPKPMAQANPFTERATAQEEARPKRTSILSTITSKKRFRPVFFCLYGAAGVGKSTFASEMPDPIFIQPERGLDQITVPKFPVPKTFIEFFAQLNALDKEDHDFKTVVIDTADALELLIWQRVCDEGKVRSIEEFGGGYGKGYVRAREIWTGVLKQLTEMSERFNIALIAHSHIRSINDPALGTPYDTHEIKLHPKSAEIVKQMVDMLLFVQLETTIAKDSPKAKKGRGIISEDRIMRTAPGTGYEAKNRYQLENPMEFSWSALMDGINHFHNR
jgi:AAA domain